MALVWVPSWRRTLGIDMVEWGDWKIWAREISLFDISYLGMWQTDSGEMGDGGIAIFPCTNGGVEWPEM